MGRPKLTDSEKIISNAKKLQYDIKYREENREKINERSRKYNTQERYLEKRDRLLAKTPCPICKLNYVKTYLMRHIETRHKLDII